MSDPDMCVFDSTLFSMMFARPYYIVLIMMPCILKYRGKFIMFLNTQERVTFGLSLPFHFIFSTENSQILVKYLDEYTLSPSAAAASTVGILLVLSSVAAWGTV